MSHKMKWGLVLAAALALLCVVGIANATPVQITVTSSTTCADGKPASNCPIGGVEIGGAVSQTATLTVIKTVPPAATGPTVTTVDVPPGPACFGVKMVGTDGQKSKESSRACVTVAQPSSQPGAATIQVIVVTTTNPSP